MKRIFPILAISTLGILSASATTVVTGSIIEFSSPDDLLLDPATNVIAVNVVNGTNPDLLVNGVLFQGDGGATAGIGTTVNGPVTVTTTRADSVGLVGPGGEITNWASAPAPSFGGGTPGSAANLSTVMESIRWSQGRDANGSTGNQLLIDVTGLTPGSLYNVQLLVNEGAQPTDRDRRWDIAVDGNLVVDDFSSEGGTGTWTPNNSFAYSGNFDPGTDGILNIVFDDDLGGDPFSGLDGNPIIQGVIIHQIPEPSTGLLAGLAAGVLVLRRRHR